MSSLKKDPDQLLPSLDTYPNLGPPEVLPEGYKVIKMLPGQQNPPPKIRWGDKFEKLSLRDRLKRAQKVADAMNHAADVAQQRVSELIDVANHQEKQLENAKRAFHSQQQTMIMMTTRHNEQQQARMQEMQELKAELREAKKRISELEAKLEQHE